VQNDETLSQLDLWASEEIDGESFENLSYWSVDCAKVGIIDAQLHMNHYFDHPADNRSTLELYPDFIPEKHLVSNGGYKGDPIPRFVF